ncbi:hypothetical protein M378DRAFT_639998 [Amanita muscaria Koide BX008]|uniref:Uncharacterized protein n=1 Tax=Amanita muscaria (strain Koide BX008) TaxID=946122 RepID=A0A0C2W2I0_AMAMK|nr:hypothetical protein M378DRAFT_639998 [Amanita muscaria Koide BX008]
MHDLRKPAYSRCFKPYISVPNTVCYSFGPWNVSLSSVKMCSNVECVIIYVDHCVLSLLSRNALCIYDQMYDV